MTYKKILKKIYKKIIEINEKNKKIYSVDFFLLAGQFHVASSTFIQSSLYASKKHEIVWR